MSFPPEAQVVSGFDMKLMVASQPESRLGEPLRVLARLFPRIRGEEDPASNEEGGPAKKGWPDTSRLVR